MPATSAVPTSMRACSVRPVYFHALPSRLSTTTLSRRGSPNVCMFAATWMSAWRAGSCSRKRAMVWLINAVRSTRSMRSSCRATLANSSRSSMRSAMRLTASRMRRKRSRLAASSAVARDSASKLL
jgi:hypothetical protein